MSTTDSLFDSFVRYHLSEAYERVKAVSVSDEAMEDSAEQWNRRVEILDDGYGFLTLSEMLDHLEGPYDPQKDETAPEDRAPLYPDDHPFDSNEALWKNRFVITQQIVDLFALFGDSWTWEEIEEAHESVNNKIEPTV